MHCSNAVKKALLALDGVESVEVDLKAGKVTVECAAAVKISQLANAIESAGYTVI